MTIAATVAIVNSGMSMVERAMHLKVVACHNAIVFGERIPGIENAGAADALSRDNIHQFYVQVP